MRQNQRLSAASRASRDWLIVLSLTASALACGAAPAQDSHFPHYGPEDAAQNNANADAGTPSSTPRDADTSAAPDADVDADPNTRGEDASAQASDDAEAGEAGEAGETGDASDPASLTILAPQRVTFNETQPGLLSIQVAANKGRNTGTTVRVFALDLPPGAIWDEDARTMRFTPDFTQGGDNYTVRFIADDGHDRVEATSVVEILDTIDPPLPRIESEEDLGGFRRLILRQDTDDFLDSPGFAGRSFRAIVIVPSAASSTHKLPVRIRLHGFGGEPLSDGWEGEFRIAPHDPNKTYWWGYASGLPERVAGTVHPYTERRILQLLEWVLRTYPGADAERVYVEGESMGGAGALFFGLRNARHIAWVESFIGQTISRNHRPSRIEQLSQLWGSPGDGLEADDGQKVWDTLDATRLLRDSPEARQQFVFTKHGKDDMTIHFGAVTQPSPLTSRTYYQAVEAWAPGHLAVWDEGGHGPPDPVLGFGWWQKGWNPIFDDVSPLRRSRAFPAFSHAAHNDDPGTGHGNGRVPWRDETGFAADVNIPGDTGWDGALAGAFNRHLRWDSRAIVDTTERLEIPLRVLDGEGSDPPAPGYPTIGDRLGRATPIMTDVTVRRIQAFQVRPGEQIHMAFGSDERVITANASTQEITITGLALEASWKTLILTR
ncbi:MAG: hypothetical protein H6729_08205 [Deltaproteobacteria bacterium]|nr:hypothetical protein [Deltaproteobacteria bacterium]